MSIVRKQWRIQQYNSALALVIRDVHSHNAQGYWSPNMWGDSLFAITIVICADTSQWL